MWKNGEPQYFGKTNMFCNYSLKRRRRRRRVSKIEYAIILAVQSLLICNSRRQRSRACDNITRSSLSFLLKCQVNQLNINDKWTFDEQKKTIKKQQYNFIFFWNRHLIPFFQSFFRLFFISFFLHIVHWWLNHPARITTLINISNNKREKRKTNG